VIETFQSRGVLLVRDVFEDDDLLPVIDEISALVDGRARTLRQRGKIQDACETASFDTRFGLLLAQSFTFDLGFDIKFYLGRAIFDFMRHPRLLDVLTPLLGPEITCSPIQHVRPKPPARYQLRKDARVVDWHQDAGSYAPEARESAIVTCWIPLVNATVEMGCLEALPGSHHLGHLPHTKDTRTLPPEVVPGIEPLGLACEKGDLVLLDKHMVHRSTANLSERCRWSVDLRYHPTGHSSGRPSEPELVVRSSASRESVLEDHGEWTRRWKSLAPRAASAG
jgi:phytanoyl-CoA hydroxylase